jgi:hypothetical protein
MKTYALETVKYAEEKLKKTWLSGKINMAPDKKTQYWEDAEGSQID